MEREAPRMGRRQDNLATKLGLITTQSPRATLRFAWRLLNARLALRSATSVGKYIKLVGKMRVANEGRLSIGDRVLIYSHVAKTELAVLKGGELKIGNGVFLNYGAEICARKYIEIGDECRIGTHCIIMDNDFHHIELNRRDEVPPSADVVIEPHVWLGNRVTVLKGVRIGYGSVVAAGSVVTKSIPSMSIAAGVPARVLRRIDEAAPGSTGPEAKELDYPASIAGQSGNEDITAESPGASGASGASGAAGFSKLGSGLILGAAATLD